MVETAEEAGMALKKQRQMLQEYLRCRHQNTLDDRTARANVTAQVLRPPPAPTTSPPEPLLFSRFFG
jgi:hypothetical protein